MVLKYAVTNYRGWILALTYGYCFGVELTIDNIIAQYFYDRFGVNISKSGTIAASFGLANIVSRPGGGLFSDYLSKLFGMRGRLWELWVVQTIGGMLCVILGRTNSLAGSIVVLLLFSLFCQPACGLTFGIVSFVSRRSLSLIPGMGGGGGNVGAVLTQPILFHNSKYLTEDGITYMGIMILACTLPIALIHFPQWGRMCAVPRRATPPKSTIRVSGVTTSSKRGTTPRVCASQRTSLEKAFGLRRGRTILSIPYLLRPRRRRPMYDFHGKRNLVICTLTDTQTHV